MTQSEAFKQFAKVNSGREMVAAAEIITAVKEIYNGNLSFASR